jgi:hypothetical protein
LSRTVLAHGPHQTSLQVKPTLDQKNNQGVIMFEGEITEQEIHAFVGRNSNSYFRSWQPALSGMGRPNKFKAAAFWLSVFWVGYRKLYKVAAVLFGILLVEIALEIVIFEGVLNMQEPPAGLNGIIGLSVAIICGNWGNSWYLSHTKQIIEEVRMKRLDEKEHLSELARRGGTSIWASVGIFAFYMVATLAVLFIMGLFIGSGDGNGVII